jgi:hypothetical protein
MGREGLARRIGGVTARFERGFAAYLIYGEMGGELCIPTSQKRDVHPNEQKSLAGDPGCGAPRIVLG